MKRFLFLAFLLLAVPAAAQTKYGTGISLPWSTLNGGTGETTLGQMILDIFGDSTAKAGDALILKPGGGFGYGSISGGGGSGWGLTGNSGTTAGTNFLGTTDSVDLVFKTKGQEIMRLGAPSATLGNIVSLTNVNNTATELRFYQPSGMGTYFSGFQAGFQDSSMSYIWPADGGSDGKALMTSDRFGDLVWRDSIRLAHMSDSAKYVSGGALPTQTSSTRAMALISNGTSASWQNTYHQSDILPLSGLINAGDTGHFYGDSYTAGTGASTGSKKFSSLVCSDLGLVEDNHGYGGATVSGGLGYPDLYDSISHITPHLNSHGWYFFQFGLNDARYTPYNTYTFETKYDSVIHYLIANGIHPDHIIMANIPYIDPDSMETLGGTSNQQAVLNTSVMDAAIGRIAIKYGVRVADIFGKEMKYGANWSLLYTDRLHPNDSGHWVISQAMEEAQLHNAYIAAATLPYNLALYHIGPHLVRYSIADSLIMGPTGAATNATMTVASQAVNELYTIPDAGANASFLFSNHIVSTGLSGIPTYDSAGVIKASNTGSDEGGEITVQTGASSSGGWARVPFNQRYAFAPVVVFSPANSAANKLFRAEGGYALSDDTGFTLHWDTTIVDSNAIFAYHVLQSLSGDTGGVPLLHFVASAGVTQSGGNVSAWQDQVSGTTSLTASGVNEPTYLATGINSLPAISFAGASHYLSATNPGLTGPFTIIMVIEPRDASDATKGAFSIGGSVTDGTPRFLMQRNSGQYKWFIYNSPVYYDATTIAQNTAHVISVTQSGGSGSTTFSAYVDGTSEGQQTTSSTLGNTTNLYVGTGFNGYANQYVAEIYIYNSVLNATDRAKVEAQLKTKYGTP